MGTLLRSKSEVHIQGYGCLKMPCCTILCGNELYIDLFSNDLHDIILRCQTTAQNGIHNIYKS